MIEWVYHFYNIYIKYILIMKNVYNILSMSNIYVILSIKYVMCIK